MMPDDLSHAHRSHGFGTRLSHGGRAGTRVQGFVNPPVMRGSTVLHPNSAARAESGHKRFDQAWVYGTLGGPTHHALEDVVAEVEGGTRCQITGTGLSAITTPLLGYLQAGDHLLVPDSVYGPTRNFCTGMLARLNVSTTFYDPAISAAGLEALMQSATRVLFLESPGSHTFEVQDVPALAAVAHRHDACVMMDNTWGIHHFQPFRHGVDVSIQALTKYVGGHSDVLLGSITTNSEAHWKKVRAAALDLGQYASPDDCWLALRGARTLKIRLQAQHEAGLVMARWFAARPEVLRVLHPGLPGAPGHEIWARDFTGACSLFGVVFQPGIPVDAVESMIDALTLFGIGASWGGFESLVLPSLGLNRTVERDMGGALCRFHIGLEDPADLQADLAAAFATLRPGASAG